MTLYEDLQSAKTEEDVKDIYIKHLKLKSYKKGLIDIQTKEMWFEAKHGASNSTYKMFTQLLSYVDRALHSSDDLHHGEPLPTFLCVIDSVKAGIMETKTALPLLEDKTVKIKWGKSASDITPEALDVVSQYIGTHFVSFNIRNNEKEFIEAVQSAIKKGEIIRAQITPDNLKQVFDKWVEMIGREIEHVKEEDYALLFFADIMSDGTVSTHENLPAELLHKNGRPTFMLNGKLYQLGSHEGYRKFWQIYDRPPKKEYRNYLLERRDCLIPTDERSFKGAYYTPLKVVDKAYELLTRALGENWQKNYIVWDMCCGVGNLETKHSNPRNLFMSTLDIADVNVMKAAKTCVQAERFQYDYLNDDITADGKIDYTLTNKVPQSLQKIIADAKDGKPGAKKILVLINPPYAETTNADNASKGSDAKNKIGIKRTKMADVGMCQYGKASNELFTQFVARIAKEIPNATLAMFSKMKYINAQAMEDFRNAWNSKYLDGFIVHSKSFDGLKGDFPIGFLIWKTDNFAESKKTPITEISCEVFDNDVKPIGEKTFYNLSTESYLSNWIKRPKPNNISSLPLTNAITPPDSVRKDQRGTKWAEDSIGYMVSGGNDFQHQKYVCILSSPASMGHGIFITSDNLWQCVVMFVAEKIVPPTWQNDRDQFLQPTKELSNEFKSDCLIWMLFNGSNLTASADNLIWDNREWSITNHFIPFTETEVNAPDRFESDFMTQYMASLPNLTNADGTQSKSHFSTEALAVLEEGRKLWRAYFECVPSYKIREELKLNRCDVGWYQIRNALKRQNEDGEKIPVSFTTFESTYKTLTEKLRPQVYEYGFLRL